MSTLQELEARIVALESANRTRANEVLANEARIKKLEADVKTADERALAATRGADASVATLEEISAGLRRTIADAEKARAEDAGRAERIKAQASAAHAKRFDDLGASIVGIGGAVRELQTKQGSRENTSTLLWAAGVFLIPALTAFAQVFVVQPATTPIGAPVNAIVVPLAPVDGGHP